MSVSLGSGIIAQMDGVQETPTDDADECFEIQNTNLQQFRQLCANANEQSRSPDVETASSLIRKLQRTVAERCADLSRTRDALHLAQNEVSSFESEIHSVKASIQQQQIEQLGRIKVAKSRLLQICDFDDTLYDSTMTSTIMSTDATRSHDEDSRNVSLSNDTCGDFCLQNGVSFSALYSPKFQEKHSVTQTVGPVVLGRPIASPVGPVRSRHRQLDTVRSESSISNQDNIEQDEYVKILDVNPNGKYVRLRNTSRNQNYNLGQCRLQQEIGGHPVAIFRFPPETTLLSQDNVTVWAEGCLPTDGTSHPTDLIFRGLQKWGAGPHFTTLLFNLSGQILSQWSASHRPSATNPFQSTNELQRPASGNKPKARSSNPTTISSKSLHAEEVGKPFQQPPQVNTCNVHSRLYPGAASQLQRPYSSVSLPSRLRKV